MKSGKHRFTWSEIRGIGLVILALVALIYYYSWWFTADTMSIWSGFAFVLALAYGLFQLVGNWTLYLATHYRSGNCSHYPEEKLTVDVFITAFKENHSLVERALLAAQAMPEDKKVWLLDDGDDPVLAQMASRLGVGYLTRSDRRNAKAGNINAALTRTTGDIIAIFDIDHAPNPDFLTKTLGCFGDLEVGFIQVMLTFANREESWISKAAADSSLDFYNPTSIGADGLRSATLIGSNALIRRKALESIGGYQPGLAEDLATSVALHAAGWRSVYIAEPLAPGISPPDLTSWFTQQLKWSRGVFELLVSVFPRMFWKLQPGHRVMYAVRMTYYWIGLFVGIHLLSTIDVLWQGNMVVLDSFEEYHKHLLPLIGMTLVIRHLAIWRWVHPKLKDASVQWKPTLLVFGTWPIYTLSWFMAIFRIPLRFQPTPKLASGRLPLIWVFPQVATLLLTLTGLIYTIIMTRTLYFLVFGVALGQIVAQSFLIIDWFRTKSSFHVPVKSISSNTHAFTETLTEPSYSTDDIVGR
jgi:cellulose synthase (UDP-forming)